MDIALQQHHPFYALSFRNYRVFFVGQTVSVAGTWMQTVAQQWLIWELTRSPAWLGIVSGAGAIPFVLFALWGGHVADRYSRRNVLIWTQAVAMLLAFALALLASNWLLPIQAWHVAALAGLSSIVNAFNMPAQQAIVSDLIEEKRALGNAIALNSLRFNLARFLGPMLAGYLLVKFSVATCFFLNALTFVAVLISLWQIRLPPRIQEAQSVSVWDGCDYLRQNQRALRIVVLVGIGALFCWPVSTLFPAFADRLGVGARGFSAMMAANGIGAAAAGLLLAAFGARFSRRLLIYGGALCFSLGILLFSFATNYYLALALLVGMGFCMILFGISSNTQVQEEVPDRLRGRVMAVYTLVFQGLLPLGGLLVGFLAEHWGEPRALQFQAACALLLLALVYSWSLRDRRARIPAGDSPARD